MTSSGALASSASVVPPARASSFLDLERDTGDLGPALGLIEFPS
jgi:hypothetical protein